MEYGRREPIQGQNGYEKTALTMKTIAELLAEEGTNMEELKRAAQPPAPRAAEPQSGLQQPPHMQLQQPPHLQVNSPPAEPVRQAAAELPPIAPAAEPDMATSEEKPRSFLSRLIGG